MSIHSRPVNIDEDRAQIFALYENAAWSAYLQDEASLFRGISNSLECIVACDEDKLIGLIRIVGDAETIIYIQDILVHTDYQRKGIGKRLIERILERYDSVRQILLLTDNTTELNAFYKHTGFKEIEQHGLKSFIRLSNP